MYDADDVPGPQTPADFAYIARIDAGARFAVRVRMSFTFRAVSSVALPLFLASSAIALGCSSASTTSDADAAADAQAEGTDCPSQDAAEPAKNADPRCPATFARLSGACAPIGLTCSYPGQGDGPPCHGAKAMLWCREDHDADPDAGGDAGVGKWVAAQ
jgi:hypothetical protein